MGYLQSYSPVQEAEAVAESSTEEKGEKVLGTKYEGVIQWSLYSVVISEHWRSDENGAVGGQSGSVA